MRTHITCLMLVLALGAGSARAQVLDLPINQRGFHAGLDPIAFGDLTSDGVTGGRSVGGIGMSMRFGWGFTERLTLALDVTVTDLAVADTAVYFLSHGDVLLRWTAFAREGPLGIWVPFLHAGLGLRDVTAEGASPTGTSIYTFAGEVLTLGAGTSIYLSRSLALFGAAYWSTGEFNDERSGNTTTHDRGVAGISSRVSLGLTWHRGRAPAAVTP